MIFLLTTYYAGDHIENNGQEMQHVWGEEWYIYRVQVGKPEVKRRLGRPRRKWEDIIKMDHKEVVWGMDWIYLTQGRDRWPALVNMVMNFRVP